jgi:YVTN family beta-propeller protein
MAAEGPGPGADVAPVKAILIADVRGYTRFTQEQGDEAAGRLAARFAELTRAVVEARDGTLVELRGDEALVVFPSPRQALRAAVELQERLVEATRAVPELPLGVGIGLDVGEPVELEGGYRGAALNVAARLCSLSGPGEVLATREVVHLARAIEGIDYADRGEERLKGIADPVRIVAVRPAGSDPAAVFVELAAAKQAQPRPSRGRRRVVLAAGLAALVAVGVALPLSLTDGNDTATAVAAQPNSVLLADAASGKTEGLAELPAAPGDLAAGDGAIWVVAPAEERVLRVDPETHAVVDTIPVGSVPAGIAVVDGSVWVVQSGGPAVARISPETGQIVETIPVGNGPVALAAAPGTLWVAARLADSVDRVDLARGKVVASVPVGDDPSALAVTPDGVWVANTAAGTVYRIDPASNEVDLTVAVGSGPADLAVVGDRLFVANSLDDTVSVVDTKRGVVSATATVGRGPVSLAATEDGVWVANETGGTLSLLDQQSLAVAQEVRLGAEPHGLSTDASGLWVSVRGKAGNHRGGTLRVVAGAGSFATIDYTAAYEPVAWSVGTLTNDGLVDYKRMGGSEGATIVPNLAARIPAPTNGGRTWSFELRPGLRWSTGEPVLASDFRRGIERGFGLEGSPVSAFFDRLVGAQACLERPPSCDLSEGIVTDDEAGTVTFRLARPDADFLYKLALPNAYPVPAGTPAQDVGTHALPATGPYMIERFVPGAKLELVRNPRFRPWAPAAQPDGYPDRIELAPERSDEATVAAVADGRADYAGFLHLDGEQLSQFSLAHPAQLHLAATPFVVYVALNVQEAPFDEPRVRQALNFAVDRSVMPAIFGGPQLFSITCQILPPNSPGYRPYCPYTTDPDPSGRWHGPDLERARSLVQASGRAGTPVTLLTDSENPLFVGASEQVAATLRALGFPVTLRKLPGERFWGAVHDQGHPMQASMWAWIADYPSASNFLGEQLTCGRYVTGRSDIATNPTRFCDEAVDAKMDEARALRLTDPAQSDRLWAEIEHELVDRAPYVPLVSGVGVDLVSSRVRNYQHNPQWGGLLDQLWVR